MKFSFALPALFITSRLCGRVYSIAAPLVASEIEVGDDNKAVLESASHNHEFLFSPPLTSMNIEVNVSADIEDILDRSLKQGRQRFFMWNQLGKRLPSHFTENVSILETPNTPSVAINSDGSRLVVGIATFDSLSSEIIAETVVYEFLNNQWEPKQTISTPSSTIVNVAISGNGSHIVLQPYDLTYFPLPVKVYLLDENGTFQPLEAGNLSGALELGISKDGNRIIQGNPYHNGSEGLVTLYEYSLSTNAYELIYSKNYPGYPALLGASVAISGNGNRIAYVTLYPSSADGSTITVFENNVFQWTQIGEIRHPNGETLGYGSEPDEIIAMSAAGTRLVVGSESMSTVSGVAYVFDQVGGTSDWILKATIEVPHKDETYNIGDICGKYISISDDGKIVAMQCTDNMNREEEYVVVYVEDSLGVWSPLGNHIKDSLRSSFAINSVAMTSDGERVAVGMYDGLFSPPIADITVYALGSTVCYDSPLPINIQEMMGDVVPFKCKWADRGQGSICDPSQTMGQLRSHCPRVCSSCQDYACVDSDTSFFWEGVERDCLSWLSSMTSSEVADLCAQNKNIRKTCRGSCGLCLPSN